MDIDDEEVRRIAGPYLNEDRHTRRTAAEPPAVCTSTWSGMQVWGQGEASETRGAVSREESSSRPGGAWVGGRTLLPVSAH